MTHDNGHITSSTDALLVRRTSSTARSATPASLHKSENLNESKVFMLAWTTTPWTLPSNVALCMNAEFDYVTVQMEESGEKYILAEGLLKNVLGEEGYTVLSTKKGSEFEYTEYEALYPFGKEKFNYREKAHFVTCDTYVTLSDGTGVVHIAPAFGEDDASVGRKYNLPFVKLVDDRGNMLECTGVLAGKFVKDADKLIIKDLKENGTLFKETLFEHSYPFCWRCDTPLLYYARSSWFIKTTAVKENLIKAITVIIDACGKEI